MIRSTRGRGRYWRNSGTTSTRAVMFDAHGKPLAAAQVPLRQIYPADGWVEHDPEEIGRAHV